VGDVQTKKPSMGRYKYCLEKHILDHISQILRKKIFFFFLQGKERLFAELHWTFTVDTYYRQKRVA